MRGIQIGVIAQEVETQYPELVLEDAEGMKSVNYSGLVAPLIEAVKALNEKCMKLDTSFSAMKEGNFAFPPSAKWLACTPTKAAIDA